MSRPPPPLLRAGRERIWRSGDLIQGRSRADGWDRLRIGLAFAPVAPAAVLLTLGWFVGSLPVIFVGTGLGLWGAQGGSAGLRRLDEVGAWRIELERGILDLEGHERPLADAWVQVERDGVGPFSPALLRVCWPDGEVARLARGRRRELSRLMAVVEEAIREAQRRRELRRHARPPQGSTGPLPAQIGEGEGGGRQVEADTTADI